MKWFIKVLNQYADFKGRASREEFWMFFLINVLVTLAIGVIGSGILMLSGKSGVAYLSVAYSMAVWIPGWAVTVRRLHDTGRSAWFLLAMLIPVIGGIWLLIMLSSKGNPDENHYGMNPLSTKQIRYSRSRSVSVALMLASVCWFLIQIIVLFMQYKTVDNLSFLTLFLPVGLIITGFILFSKRIFYKDVAWSFLLLSVVWLIRDILMIWNLSSDLALSFNLFLVIKMMNILVPVGLLLSGLYILLKRTDRTVPACFLFVGSCVWILTIILIIIQSSNITDVSMISMLILDMMVITTPVSLMVLARTLLSKNITSKEPKNTLLDPGKITGKTGQPEFEQPAGQSVQPPGHAEQADFVYVASQVEQQETVKTAVKKAPQEVKQTTMQTGQPEPERSTLLLPEQPKTKQPPELPEQPKTKQPPELNPDRKPATINDLRKKIIFLRKDKDGNNVWVVYKAPTKTDAMEFLSNQRIDRPSYFIVVETPEGNFGRDKDGFYQE